MRWAVSMIVIMWSAATGSEPRPQWHLPTTIRVTQDVQVKACDVHQPRARGVLCAGRDDQPFEIPKGRAFQMVRTEGGEGGGCDIRFERRTVSVGACPWLDGFTDHQSDIFVVVKK